MIGYIGTVVDGELISQEEFNAFVAGPESDWFELPIAPGVWNCTKQEAPDDQHIFDKTVCKWMPA